VDRGSYLVFESLARCENIVAQITTPTSHRSQLLIRDMRCEILDQISGFCVGRNTEFEGWSVGG
jgi:hypothetical protein